MAAYTKQTDLISTKMSMKSQRGKGPSSISSTCDAIILVTKHGHVMMISVEPQARRIRSFEDSKNS
jgi:hypothetical protein